MFKVELKIVIKKQKPFKRRSKSAFSGTPCQIAGLKSIYVKNMKTCLQLILFVMVYQVRKCGECIWMRLLHVSAERI